MAKRLTLMPLQPCKQSTGRFDAGADGLARWELSPVSSVVERLSYKEDVAGSNPAPGICQTTVTAMFFG